MSLRNRKLIGWKVWYGNGTVLTSEFNKWEDISQLNVQFVKLFYQSDSGVEVSELHNQEYYILDELHIDILPKEIKLGRSIDKEQYWELFDKAHNDNSIIEVMI